MAKFRARLASSIREAVGQPFEYKFFEVAKPQAGLNSLASKPIPQEWHDYLERDRGIGLAWRSEDRFHLSDAAKRTFGPPGQD